MANIVFVLGAGASRQGGCPVMAEFLPKARHLYATGQLGQFADDFELVDRVIQELLRGHSKVRSIHSHMEWVFNAIEIGIACGRLGNMSRDELQRCKEGFIRLIVGVLELTQDFKIHQSIGTPMLPEGYDELGRFVRRVTHRDGSHSVSFITFNYDIGLEISLARHEVPYFYSGLEDGDADCCPVIKPHGSVNWARTNDEDQPIAVIPIDIESFFEPTGSTFLTVDRFPLWEHYERFRRQNPTSEGVFIVPPSESKAESRSSLASLWEQAANQLANANMVVIAGYSLPDTDQFFKNFFTVGLLSDTELRQVHVINPDSQVKARFQDLLDGYARDRFKMQTSYFGDGIRNLDSEYTTLEGAI